MHKNHFHLLYLTEESWPTFRPDVAILFGKYLPRYGVTSDLVAAREIATQNIEEVPWGGGKAILCNVPNNRAGQYLITVWHNLRVMITMDAKKYQAIQVRDMSVTALAGLVLARLKGIQFYYWLSYPQSEGQIDRAMTRGIKGGMRFWFPLVQGFLGKWMLYRIVLPRADHLFVQSRQMQLDIAKQGIPVSKMTPVPMGVDTEISGLESIQPIADHRLEGKRVIAYLGTLDSVRKIEILFQMLSLISLQIPNIILVLIGDTEDDAHRDWLIQEADRLGVANQVLWTGWLPTGQAWSYLRAAELGLSPFPRGYLLDSCSPTKAIEYLALGLPVVVNDNPEQAKVIEESGAGICVPLQAEDFAQAVIHLLNSPTMMQLMGVKGVEYVVNKRGYDTIARMVAEVYLKLNGDVLDAKDTSLAKED
jgi:glycosyltransferase involved in cell wall biosynthesis